MASTVFICIGRKRIGFGVELDMVPLATREPARVGA
jgi:hypothetical protein